MGGVGNGRIRIGPDPIGEYTEYDEMADVGDMQYCGDQGVSMGTWSGKVDIEARENDVVATNSGLVGGTWKRPDGWCRVSKDSGVHSAVPASQSGGDAEPSVAEDG